MPPKSLIAWMLVTSIALQPWLSAAAQTCDCCVEEQHAVHDSEIGRKAAAPSRNDNAELPPCCRAKKTGQRVAYAGGMAADADAIRAESDDNRANPGIDVVDSRNAANPTQSGCCDRGCQCPRSCCANGKTPIAATTWSPALLPNACTARLLGEPAVILPDPELSRLKRPPRATPSA